MQGLGTNFSSGFSATDGANPSTSGANGLNKQNTDIRSPSPLSSNLPSDAAQSPFKSQLSDAFAMQALPLEGQGLPPDAALGLNNQSNSGLLNANELKRSLAQLFAENSSEESGEIPLAVNVNISPYVAADVQAIRSAGLSRGMTESGAVASQLAGQGQNRLQQDMLTRQLAMSYRGGAEDESFALRLPLPLENMSLQNNTTQLSNMLQDAMFKQQSSTNSGAEIKAGDTFSSALGSLATLNSDVKSGGETKPLLNSSLNTPFSQQAEWGEEVGSRIKWMVNSQVQNAELKMNPAHLGPLEVKITLQNEQTTIVFTAQNSAVREALDSALPRLREMLGENGMNQVDVDVSEHSFAQQQQASEEERESLEGNVSETDGLFDSENTEEGLMMLSSRMVDLYA